MAARAVTLSATEAPYFDTDLYEARELERDARDAEKMAEDEVFNDADRLACSAMRACTDSWRSSFGSVTRSRASGICVRPPRAHVAGRVV
jgi:hypothetical protein